MKKSLILLLSLAVMRPLLLCSAAQTHSSSNREEESVNFKVKKPSSSHKWRIVAALTAGSMLFFITLLYAGSRKTTTNDNNQADNPERRQETDQQRLNRLQREQDEIEARMQQEAAAREREQARQDLITLDSLGSRDYWSLSRDEQDRLSAATGRQADRERINRRKQAEEEKEASNEITYFAARGNLERVRSLVSKAEQWSKKIATWYAAEHGHREIVDYLLEHGGLTSLDINTLNVTIRQGNVAMVKLILEKAAPIIKKERRIDELETAAVNGQLEILKLFFENDSNGQPYVNDEAGIGNALVKAAKFGKLAIVKYLVENTNGHAHVNKLAYKKAALKAAAKSNRVDVMQLLLGNEGNANGAPHVGKEEDKESAFLEAAKADSVDAVKLLLRGGHISKDSERMGQAADYAEPHVTVYLFKNNYITSSTKGIMEKSLKKAIAAFNPESVQYLLASYKFAKPTIGKIFMYAVNSSDELTGFYNRSRGTNAGERYKQILQHLDNQENLTNNYRTRAYNKIKGVKYYPTRIAKDYIEASDKINTDNA